MQDRFKFRYNNNNKIYDVFAIDFFHSTGQIVLLDRKETLMCKINLDNLIQCTGLKDKNGKLIYEGDIVEAITHNPYEKHIGVIQFHMCYFSLDYIKLGKYSEAGISLTKNIGDFVSLNIIGNIYENPELLERNNDKIIR